MDCCSFFAFCRILLYIQFQSSEGPPPSAAPAPSALFIYPFIYPVYIYSTYIVGFRSSLKCQCKGFHFVALIGFEHVVTKNSIPFPPLTPQPRPWSFRFTQATPHTHSHTHTDADTHVKIAAVGNFHHRRHQDTRSRTRRIHQWLRLSVNIKVPLARGRDSGRGCYGESGGRGVKGEQVGGRWAQVGVENKSLLLHNTFNINLMFYFNNYVLLFFSWSKLHSLFNQFKLYF